MALLDLIFPKSCLGCNKTGQYICQSCLDKVPILKPACPNCERPSIDGFTHARCKKALGLDGLCSVWRYEAIIKSALQSLKYKYATEIVQELCGYLVPELNNLTVKSILDNDFYLIPIPIHWYKQNTRGFNQSEEIGKVVADKMGWGFEPNLLIRRRSARPQAGLGVKERKINVRGVFTVNPNYMIPGGKCILFDDVFTTGSTLKEACKVLKKCGAARVWGITVAR